MSSLVFDAYFATLREPGLGVDAGPVADALAFDLGGSVSQADRGMHGYTSQLLIDAPALSDQGPVRVLYGGANLWPSVQVQGSASPAVADSIRSRWVHDVTRVDSCQDVDSPDAFEVLTSEAITFAKERGLKLGTSGDWITGKDGRTLYVGSRKATALLRVYEKGKQSKYALRPEVSRNWVRAELETHPKGAQRVAAASLTASEVWGMSRWSQELHGQWMAREVPRVDADQWRQSDDDRALDFMVEQYGPMLGRLTDSIGRDALTAKLWRLVDRRNGVTSGGDDDGQAKNSGV